MKCFQIKNEREIRFVDRWPFDPSRSDLPLYCHCTFWLSRTVFLSTCAHVKCINFLSVSRLTGSDHDVLMMVRAHVITSCPSPHCLMSSAGPSGSWIRRGGGFLPRSISNPVLVAINHTAAWLSCLISVTDSFSVLCLQIPVICWFLCQVVVMCLGVLTPL